MLIGVSFRTAPISVREGFCFGRALERHSLQHLSTAEGIEEVALLTTCERTEFLIWASDPSLAANSVLRLLCSGHNLQLCQWEHFYRLIGESAVAHLFRVAGGLDSMVTGDQHQLSRLRTACETAEESGSAGKCLQAIFEKAFAVSERIRSNPVLGWAGLSLASAALAVAQQAVGTLEHRRIVLVGAGNLAQTAAAYIANQGGTALRILNRTFEAAVQLATKVGGTAVPIEDLYEELGAADLAIFAAGAAGANGHLLSEGQAIRPARRQARKTLCILDLGLPRSVDPAVRSVPGYLLYDLDDVQRALLHNAGESSRAALTAESIADAEASEFYRAMQPQHVVPIVVALRSRIGEICQQELRALREELGPFPKEQEKLLGQLTSRITQGLATSLVQEMRDVPEKSEQEHIAHAVHRLFHLQSDEKDAAASIAAST